MHEKIIIQYARAYGKNDEGKPNPIYPGVYFGIKISIKRMPIAQKNEYVPRSKFLIITPKIMCSKRYNIFIAIIVPKNRLIITKEIMKKIT